MILLRYENMRKEELEVIGSTWDILGHAGVAYLLEDLGAFASEYRSQLRGCDPGVTRLYCLRRDSHAVGPGSWKH